MMPGTVAHPFAGPPVETITLDSPPLASVLVQVRFAQVLNAVEDSVAAQLQQRFRDEYPFVAQQAEAMLIVLPGVDTAPAPATNKLWRFADRDNVWSVTLSTSFVALQTAAYAGHEDFFARLRRVLDAVSEIVDPPAVERVGARYTQRLRGDDDLARLTEYVRPEVLGASVVHDDTGGLSLCLTQAQAQFDDATLTARWGTLPANAGIDPVIAPLPEATWVMDIDVFDEMRDDFVPEVVTARALAHSRRQYRFFRWAVEPSFLIRYGADQELVAHAVEEMV
jgi:uncharacterized protein (TIGR04255 family)